MCACRWCPTPGAKAPGDAAKGAAPLRCGAYPPWWPRAAAAEEDDDEEEEEEEEEDVAA